MKTFAVINHAVLFLCVSLYFGTGWSMVLFSLPVSKDLTVDNYYLQIVPVVAAATKVLTVATIVMFANLIVMGITEWRTRLRWVPIAVFLLVLAATLLTELVIFPINREMAAHVTDPQRLRTLLDSWGNLNRIRTGLWSLQWGVMMYYFAVQHLALRGAAASPLPRPS